MIKFEYEEIHHVKYVETIAYPTANYYVYIVLSTQHC